MARSIRRAERCCRTARCRAALGRQPAPDRSNGPYKRLCGASMSNISSYERMRIIASRAHASRGELVDRALASVTVDGLFLEFGVMSGRKLNIIVPNRRKRSRGAFDSFSPTAVEWKSRNTTKAAFFHLDCSTYATTRRAFFELGVKIIAGTVIVHDDFFNFDGWETESLRAWSDFVTSRRLRYKYIGHVVDDHMIALKVVSHEHPDRS